MKTPLVFECTVYDIVTMLRSWTMYIGLPFTRTVKQAISGNDRDLGEQLWDRLITLKDRAVADGCRPSSVLTCTLSKSELSLILNVLAMDIAEVKDDPVEFKIHLGPRDVVDACVGRLQLQMRNATED